MTDSSSSVIQNSPSVRDLLENKQISWVTDDCHEQVAFITAQVGIAAAYFTWTAIPQLSGSDSCLTSMGKFLSK